jgi:hypothetical protein
MTSIEDRILIEDTLYRYASCIPTCGRSTATQNPRKGPTR